MHTRPSAASGPYSRDPIDFKHHSKFLDYYLTDGGPVPLDTLAELSMKAAPRWGVDPYDKSRLRSHAKHRIDTWNWTVRIWDEECIWLEDHSDTKD